MRLNVVFIITKVDGRDSRLGARHRGKEKKDVNTDFSKTEGTPQLRRYLESLGNLVLTDYLEFRWYVGGEHRLTARTASVSQNGKLRVSESGFEEVRQPLSAFLATQVPTVNNPPRIGPADGSIGSAHW